MFFELDVPVPEPALPLPPAYNPKGKAKQNTALKLSEQPLPPPLLFNATQIAALETRIELLAQLGYTVLCLTQTERGPIDPKSFINVLTALIATLNASPRKPPQIVLSTRLTLVLDNTCDGGFGLTQSNAALFGGYDVLALRPLTVQTFSQACLTHAAPGPLTAHIIVVPLSPRVPFPLKHTLVRTARRAGAVFELSFAGAIRGDEGWWGSAREVVRVAKGKGIVITGGGEPRAPRDLANLAGLLDLQPNVAHDAVTGTCRSVLIRARKS
ncbi:Polymerase/histidinol phosphatase-like protein [Auriculariales sp. MPI-PUGE-AT-0066]|nr:Polymerase/histidinol phosphatase-like protein [Auriculariales sp. MPI-PUGE-AT-0066]